MIRTATNASKMVVYQLTVFYREMGTWVKSNLKIEIYIRIVAGVIIGYNAQVLGINRTFYFFQYLVCFFSN
ncbi:hypothetical protein D3C86_1376080 [compost metagenome]